MLFFVMGVTVGGWPPFFKAEAQRCGWLSSWVFFPALGCYDPGWRGRAGSQVTGGVLFVRVVRIFCGRKAWLKDWCLEMKLQNRVGTTRHNALNSPTSRQGARKIAGGCHLLMASPPPEKAKAVGVRNRLEKTRLVFRVAQFETGAYPMPAAAGFSPGLRGAAAKSMKSEN